MTNKTTLEARIVEIIAEAKASHGDMWASAAVTALCTELRAQTAAEQPEKEGVGRTSCIDCVSISDPQYRLIAQCERCKNIDAALSALDAQGGEAVAWRWHYRGETEWHVTNSTIIRDTALEELRDFSGGECQSLYTHPSPAAVQALREALSALCDAYAQLEQMYSEGRANPINCDEWRNAQVLLAQKDGRPKWKHKKRGTIYTEIGRGKFQCEGELDMADCVVYKGEDGALWIRPVALFEDGRFEKINLAPEGEHCCTEAHPCNFHQAILKEQP